MESKTQSIFEATAPYANIYQMQYARVLFVCAGGLLRSPTAAEIGVSMGWNCRSCGTWERALIPLSANLIEWATTIVFLDREAMIVGYETFTGTDYYDSLFKKSVVIDILDNYDFRDKHLISILTAELTTLRSYVESNASTLENPYEE